MKYSVMLLIVIGFAVSGCKQNVNVFQYNIDANWQFKAVSDSIWLPATVPGCVHTDLMDNGIIDDPFYRLNEHDIQWIDKKQWEYKTVFSVDEELLQHDVVELSFKGLDTYARIFLNHKLILRTDNMFMQWDVNCKKFLQPGENELYIVFDSPINVGMQKREELGYYLPGAENDQSQLGGVGDIKTCVFTRKAQYHYGWDWGPRLVTSGIWQDITLSAWNGTKILDLNIVQDVLDDEHAVMHSKLEILATTTQEVTITGSIDAQTAFKETMLLNEGVNDINIPFEITNPQRWWPNGLGEQKLYSIAVEVAGANGVMASTSRKVGLRTIEVIQKPDSIGSSFYFQVNGMPVFMKGANYIPQDVFLSRVSDDDYRKIISSAVEANFNMLRVWGGGIYEKDIFYDLCDEYGILVWQDFMFACAMYPGNQSFLDNVEREVVQNVKRLRNHPSIALWCGDNEILSAWNRWGWKENVIENQGEAIADTVWEAYDNIFHRLLPEVIKNNDPQKLYWSSSPSSGFGELENGKSGDNHYWGVWWAKEPFAKYKEEIPRFMSEYGFQSFPDLNSVKKYALPEDWDIDAEVMKSHQRSSIGNVTIKEYMQRDYKDPKDFPMFLYVNHVLQAEGIKMAIEAHRRNMPYCMGSLYWQINDCWPVASWSGIDSYGNWKAMHYFVKKAFSDILVSPDIDTLNRLNIFVVSDRRNDIEGTLKLTLLNFDGDIVKQQEQPIHIKANTSHKQLSIPGDKYLEQHDAGKVFMVAEVYDAEGQLLSQNNLYFVPVKDLALPVPAIETTIATVNGGFTVTLTTNKLAKNVYLRADELEGHFSDNYFDLLPGATTTILFNTDTALQQPVDEALFRKRLNVFSLVDSY